MSKTVQLFVIVTAALCGMVFTLIRSKKIGGLDFKCNPVNISYATAITYDLCVSACEGEPPSFSRMWLLPYLSLISQLPFGARHRLDNFTSVFLTIGSTMLAGYTLILTVLDNRWIARRFEALAYPNTVYAVRVLTFLHQAPLRVATQKSLLSSLVVLPQNDAWWYDLADFLKYTHTWSISAATSIIWVIVAYILTFVDSLADNSSTNSAWLWLPAVVVGWLQLSPKCDFGRLKSVLDRASAMSYVASHQGAVRHSFLSNERAISIAVHGDEKLDSSDEGRSPPIFNYARALPWAKAVEEIFATFLLASEYAWARRPSENGGIHPDHRSGDRDAVDAYRRPRQPAYRSHWPSGIFTRMLFASLMASALQWGTIGVAALNAWYSPPKALGCLSGALSNIVWMMLIVSSVLSHYSNSYDKSFTSRPARAAHAARTTSEIQYRLGKMIATRNTIWIIVVCLFQLSTLYNECYCESAKLGLGNKADVIMEYLPRELDQVRIMWTVALVVTSGSALGLVGLISLVLDSHK
ncbi:hypothetical protein SERLADRAFT_448876 [Serpula lacrymans var. lacrymans S7.9]|uniref:Uncharacterized protein n=1 Tax=Serpula lacrymans var. lacrymans (strain S7.9) TaxID=578457 RepID=F8NV31_SERL9|nr:uncharacterized protein SERLADRAFT_448876 [Serpula lacrymans var. lacrymans S7.9]EGO25986.1 hypothetical protein SERLADRAFT_448876 [Serpula lacrymans var. lacrymans S7.9]